MASFLDVTAGGNDRERAVDRLFKGVVRVELY